MNAKLHTAEQIEQIKRSIEDFGFNDPIGVWGDENLIVEGHGRYLAAQELGLETVPVIRLDHLTDEQRREYTLIHNQTTLNSGYEDEVLRAEIGALPDLDFNFYGFDLSTDDIVASDEDRTEGETDFLKEKPDVPYCSVLDTKTAKWMERRRDWIALGIASEVGRDDDLLGASYKALAEKCGFKSSSGATGTSVFDPVLCEVLYRWFCPTGGKIFDPFAGGSVRGVVAGKLGFDYMGIDLRQEQIEANRKNAEELGVKAEWRCDDSLNADKYMEDGSCDLVFSCPPYADLEVYSDDPRDISTMDYADFCDVYGRIISIACRKLKKGGFAIFTVSDVRDKAGLYRNFPEYTKKCFHDNGLETYNNMVLLNSVGTSSATARGTFSAGRKVRRIHQNVLVFRKKGGGGRCSKK